MWYTRLCYKSYSHGFLLKTPLSMVIKDSNLKIIILLVKKKKIKKKSSY